MQEIITPKEKLLAIFNTFKSTVTENNLTTLDAVQDGIACIEISLSYLDKDIDIAIMNIKNAITHLASINIHDEESYAATIVNLIIKDLNDFLDLKIIEFKVTPYDLIQKALVDMEAIKTTNSSKDILAKVKNCTRDALKNIRETNIPAAVKWLEEAIKYIDKIIVLPSSNNDMFEIAKRLNKVLSELSGKALDEYYTQTCTETYKFMPKSQRGIYNKYIVRRADGSDKPGGKHSGCKIFALDLDHDPYAYSAIIAYAQACKEQYPALAIDLFRQAKAMIDTGLVPESSIVQDLRDMIRTGAHKAELYHEKRQPKDHDIQ